MIDKVEWLWPSDHTNYECSILIEGRKCNGLLNNGWRKYEYLRSLNGKFTKIYMQEITTFLYWQYILLILNICLYHSLYMTLSTQGYSLIKHSLNCLCVLRNDIYLQFMEYQNNELCLPSIMNDIVPELSICINITFDPAW